LYDNLEVKKNQYGVAIDERVPSIMSSPARLDKVSKIYQKKIKGVNLHQHAPRIPSFLTVDSERLQHDPSNHISEDALG